MVHFSEAVTYEPTEGSGFYYCLQPATCDQGNTLESWVEVQSDAVKQVIMNLLELTVEAQVDGSTLSILLPFVSHHYSLAYAWRETPVKRCCITVQSRALPACGRRQVPGVARIQPGRAPPPLTPLEGRLQRRLVPVEKHPVDKQVLSESLVRLSRQIKWQGKHRRRQSKVTFPSSLPSLV